MCCRQVASQFEKISKFVFWSIPENIIFKRLPWGGGQRVLGHPHEHRQTQSEGPQQVLVIYMIINFLSILHLQF